MNAVQGSLSQQRPWSAHNAIVNVKVSVISSPAISGQGFDNSGEPAGTAGLVCCSSPCGSGCKMALLCMQIWQNQYQVLVLPREDWLCGAVHPAPVHTPPEKLWGFVCYCLHSWPPLCTPLGWQQMSTL